MITNISNKNRILLSSFCSIFIILTFSGCSSSDSNDVVATINDGSNASNSAVMTTLVDGTIVQNDRLVSLGEKLFNDENLSTPAGQSCASCHDLLTGFDDPNSSNPTSMGADGTSFGTRNSPTASYAAHIPQAQILGGELIGGLFLDGRAISLEEQAKGPFLNPVEMGNESAQEVIDKIKLSSYANDFESLFGLNVLNDSDSSYNYVADAIAAFERSSVFSPFTAKFDRVRAGTESFTAAEERGRNLFRGKAECTLCHNNSQGTLVFSDFRYKNIGVPSNPLLPAFISDPSFVDLGLGAVTGDSRNNGQFRTSSLRNIAITAPYMHNGVFNTLEEVLDFYNTRDTTFTEAPEVSENLDQVGNIGELNLTANEISDLIAFLNTMTDQ